MEKVLDHRVIEELLWFADDGDPELLVDLIQMFLEDGPAKVEAVSTGLASGNFDMAERAAHSLKGSSGSLGAKLVQAICGQIEETTHMRELEASRLLAPKLELSYAAAEQALKLVLAEHQN